MQAELDLVAIYIYGASHMYLYNTCTQAHMYMRAGMHKCFSYNYIAATAIYVVSIYSNKYI